jgi:putative transposase
MENGHIESFNGKFREECLNQNAFKNMSEAKKIVEEWRVDEPVLN